MRWKAKPENPWKRRFALLPVKIGDQWLWMERYYSAYWGECLERATPEQCAEIIAAKQ
jgi:hypothetical protein